MQQVNVQLKAFLQKESKKRNIKAIYNKNYLTFNSSSLVEFGGPSGPAISNIDLQIWHEATSATVCNFFVHKYIPGSQLILEDTRLWNRYKHIEAKNACANLWYFSSLVEFGDTSGPAIINIDLQNWHEATSATVCNFFVHKDIPGSQLTLEDTRSWNRDKHIEAKNAWANLRYFSNIPFNVVRSPYCEKLVQSLFKGLSSN